MSERPTPETHVRCPECKELVRMDATTCAHCGTKLLAQPITLPARAKPARGPWFWGGAGALLLLGFLVLKDMGRPATTGYPPVGVSDSTLEGIATLINVNGKLCGKVTSATHTGANRYAVACNEYRDGSGTVKYVVNLATGKLE